MKSIKRFAALFAKDIRLHGRKMLSTLLLIVLLLVGCALALGAVLGSATEKKDKTVLALVDNDASTLSKTVVDFVSGSEGVTELFEMERLDSAEKAQSGVESGKYGGAIIFEEDYLSRILDGESEAVRIIIGEAVTDSAQTVLHFAKTGEKLIKVAEYGVMSAWKPLRKVYSVDETHKILGKMEIIYALRLLSIPEMAFEKEEMQYADSNVGIAEYYIIAFTVFLMILIEVIFFPYTAMDCAPPMLKRIRSYGIGGAALTFEKAIVPFTVRGVVLFGVASLLDKKTDMVFNAETFIFALCGMFILSVFFSSLSVLFSQTPLGISIIFAIAVSGLFLSGGLVPISMLPNTVIEFGKFTPSGICTSFIAPLFDGNRDFASLAVFAAITAVAYFAAVIYTRRICERGGAAR